MLNPDLNATQIGTVGEQLTRYKLLRWGYEAVTVEQGNDYDMIVLSDQPIRLQVKATAAPDLRRPASYRFSTRKSSRNAKRYSASQIDGFAFVALDRERVLFYDPFISTCKRISVSDFTRENELATWWHVVDSMGKT